MASISIHLAVAQNVNKILKRNEKEFFLGAIAPDIAKFVGLDRKETHFIKKEDNTDTPNIELFYNKYKKYLNNNYELGYYVHLLTDKLWFDEFLPNFIINDNTILDKEGNEITLKGISIDDIIYNDYTNLNVQIIDYYNLNLSLFYEKFNYPNNNIAELPSKHFDDIINKLSSMCTTNTENNYIINIEKIVHFIDYCTIYILDNIKKVAYE